MHEFFEESFDLENTFEDILSIQVSLNGFSFSVLRPSDGKIVAIKSMPLKISSNKLIARRFKEWFKNETILQKTFQKVRIIIFSEKFTFVPKSLFSSDIKDEISHILFKEANQLQFAENIVESTNSKLLFALPEGLMETINDTIGDCSIIHPVKLLANYIAPERPNKQLLLLFNNNNLYLVLKDEHKILLANNFTVKHINDVVYFVLTALKQMGIQSKTIDLYFAGKSAYSANIDVNLNTHLNSIKKLDVTEIDLPTELISENIALFI